MRTCAKRLFQIPQGISADLIATLEGFTREDLDAIRVAFATECSQGYEGMPIFEISFSSARSIYGSSGSRPG